MKNRTTYIFIAAAIGFIVYCFVVGPLRNAFDDRWPYVYVFLNSPGGAAKAIAVIAGLFLACQSARSGNVNARLFAIGFGLVLLAGLMRAMYAAWALDHRIELQALIFDQPFRLTVWKWFFRIDISQCVGSLGMVCVVLAAVRSFQLENKLRDGPKMNAEREP